MNDYGYRETETPVRLTRRGKVVAAILWAASAWMLATALPFWWTRL